MTISRRDYIVSTALLAGGVAASPVLAASRRFRIYDALQSYVDRPTMADYGIDPLHWADPPIWTDRTDLTLSPSMALARGYVASIPGDGTPFVLDVEQFPVGGPMSGNAVRQILSVATMFRRLMGRRSLGFYSVLPQGDYWRAIADPAGQEHRAWQAENNLLAPVERVIDALYPSLYTFYPDRDGWVAYARSQIREARRISRKPVYPFLWPEYHLSSRSRGFIEPDYWRLQLETVHRLADGLVIFGGWDERAKARRPWDAQAAWWLVLQDFMAEHGLVPVRRSTALSKAQTTR